MLLVNAASHQPGSLPERRDFVLFAVLSVQKSENPFEGHKPRPLPDSQDAGIDALRPALDRLDRVLCGKTEVVMKMKVKRAERDPVVDAAMDLLHVFRPYDPHRVRVTETVDAERRKMLVKFDQLPEFRPRSVFAGKFYRKAEFLGVADGIGGPFIDRLFREIVFLPALLVDAAEQAYPSQAKFPDQADLVFIEPRMPYEPRPQIQLRYLGYRLPDRRRGSRVADLDEVHADLVQQDRYPLLDLHREEDAVALFSFPESGVQYFRFECALVMMLHKNCLSHAKPQRHEEKLNQIPDRGIRG